MKHNTRYARDQELSKINHQTPRNKLTKKHEKTIFNLTFEIEMVS